MKKSIQKKTKSATVKETNEDSVLFTVREERTEPLAFAQHLSYSIQDYFFSLSLLPLLFLIILGFMFVTTSESN